MEAYCVKCRAKREIEDSQPITMKNGKPATQGVCPVCGTKVFRIGAVRWKEEVSMEAFEPPPADMMAEEGGYEPPPV